MSTSMIAFLIIMGFTLIIHGGMTYLVLKKKEYSFISGFYNRSKEEQQQLIENGYPQAIGKLLLYTFIILFVSVVLALIRVPYGFEIGLGLFLIVLLGGTVYVQKYELAHKRKKNYWISGIITVIVIVFVTVLVYFGFQENEIIIDDQHLKVTGVYGVEWPIEEISQVKLLNELPEVIVKTNGFAAFGRLKGSFRLEKPYGGGKLFVHNGYEPYLYVEKGDDYIILNRKNNNETQKLYDELLEKVKTR
ncbi:DUF3784 domain-containing protein [Aeribacillus pallidus]|uniref:DUF3784 domain-containing protein n=1 Tax=Aeribacillus pallidus TaxID=33936 RepID=UPI003D1D277E